MNKFRVFRDCTNIDFSTDKAKEYYTRSAKLENSMAQNMLGLIASDKKDYKTAFGWYTKAVETNEKNIAALYNLGNCYQRGEGVIRDIGKAKEYYTKAAEFGNSDSQNKLGDMAYSKKNYREAERLYKKAIETNEKNANALFKLGYCYYISKDEKTAKKYLLKAIELGRTDAAPFLGVIYFNEENYAESLGYFREGARNNDPRSVFMLGYCYRYGMGVSSNEEKAVNYFQQAKDLGYKDENNELNKLKIFGHYI
jgi:TPR repeat protein